ncbi:hypothetical protein CgunFtcFv8_022922 [Champsocephalus gunnari]|uniref:Uncharacterized protein n=1 Tax=Champsocephalus gunnari TaxID=52237 RepID=A0AAN8DBE6_CHAGU|nr:hypothetical protein CgunFtcFv8_022922 [Champsocephalus gunnari]
MSSRSFSSSPLMTASVSTSMTRPRAVLMSSPGPSRWFPRRTLAPVVRAVPLSSYADGLRDPLGHSVGAGAPGVDPPCPDDLQPPASRVPLLASTTCVEKSDTKSLKPTLRALGPSAV